MPADIEVVVRHDAGTVTVQVRTDKPDQQVRVLILAESNVVANPSRNGLDAGVSVWPAYQADSRPLG